jgi:hypothetical protein
LAWLLPVALLATAYLQLTIARAYPAWGGWLQPVLVGGSILAALALALTLLRVYVQVAPGVMLGDTRTWAGAVIAMGLLVLAIAPVTWSAQAVAAGQGRAWLPQAGPAGTGPGGAGGAFQGARNGFGGPGGGFGGSGQGFGGRGRNTGGTPGFGGSSGLGGRGQGTDGAAVPQSGVGASGSAPQSMGAASGSAGQSGPGGSGFSITQGGARPQLAGGRGGGFGGGRVGGFGGGSGGAMTFAGNQTPALSAKLIDYLLAKQDGAKFLVATTTSSYASLFILQTNQPAMALGGYQGWDQILTPAQLAKAVAGNTVRYFYIAAGRGAQFSQPGGGQITPAGSGQSAAGASSLPGDTDATGALTGWVAAHCSAVPFADWETTIGNAVGGSFGGGGLQLYSCASLVKK